MARKMFTDESLATLVSEIKSYTDDAVSTKADSSHTHAISNITNLQSSLDAKVPASRTINGRALTANITLSASDVSAYTKTEIDNMELITVDDIDTICGATIQVASAEGVTF